MNAPTNTGNAFLSKSSELVNAAVALDDATEKAIKELDKQITKAREAESTGIKILQSYVDAGRQIPAQTLLNGITTSDPDMIRADIKARINLDVSNLESQKKALYQKAHGTPKERFESKVMDGADAAGKLIGKAAHLPVQSILKVCGNLKNQTMRTVESTRDKLVNISVG